MKSLTLFRHAKTERESASGRDFDRRLNERGRSDAERMGKEIRELGLDFDTVLCSPANRATETAQLAGLKSQLDESIYDAPTGDLLSLARSSDDSAARVLMVGHNPGFERLASQLVGESIEMPTGSLIEVELPIEKWRDLEVGSGRIVRFIKPKELR